MAIPRVQQFSHRRSLLDRNKHLRHNIHRLFDFLYGEQANLSDGVILTYHEGNGNHSLLMGFSVSDTGFSPLTTLQPSAMLYGIVI